MKITILNGNPNKQDTDFENHLSLLGETLQKEHNANIIRLRELSIQYCVGCFGCWVKKPGECLFPDGSTAVRRAVIQCDLLIFASPILMGFTSAVLKQATDKLIPLIHPYMVIDQGEVHHRKRYEAYPLLGLLLQPEADTDQEDLQIITHSYERLAINFKTKLAFMRLITDPVKEVVHEINRL